MSISKNYLYNLVYQIVVLLVPLVTIPYISRTLGSEGIGINAYTNSIIQYFILFGTIGIALYGNRTIAYVRDNKGDLSRTFWGIFSLKLITSFIAFLVFFFFLQITDSYQLIFLIQSIFLLAAMTDISWLFMGLEDFKKTVIRNLFVKFLGVVCIFIFVKTPDDLWKYVFILAFSQFLGNLSLWLYIPKTVNFVKIKWEDIKKHFMPSVALFIPEIAIQIYVVMNKTMLGFITSASEVGFFDNSEKIIKVTLAIVTAMGVVMLPRIANKFANGEMAEVKNYLFQSFNFASYLSFPLMFGLAGIASEFTPWFFGPGFSKTSTLMVVISPIIVFIAWSNVIGVQYLMPLGKVRAFTLSVTIGAIVNLIFNLLLIKNYLSIGAAISTVIAEFVVIAVQLFLVRNEINVLNLFHSVWKYIISGLVMYVVVRIIPNFIHVEIWTTFIQILLGAITYFVLLFLLKSEMNNKLFQKGLHMVRNK